MSYRPVAAAASSPQLKSQLTADVLYLIIQDYPIQQQQPLSQRGNNNNKTSSKALFADLLVPTLTMGETGTIDHYMAVCNNAAVHCGYNHVVYSLLRGIAHASLIPEGDMKRFGCNAQSRADVLRAACGAITPMLCQQLPATLSALNSVVSEIVAHHYYQRHHAADAHLLINVVQYVLGHLAGPLLVSSPALWSHVENTVKTVLVALTQSVPGDSGLVAVAVTDLCACGVHMITSFVLSGRYGWSADASAVCSAVLEYIMALKALPRNSHHLATRVAFTLLLREYVVLQQHNTSESLISIEALVVNTLVLCCGEPDQELAVLPSESVQLLDSLSILVGSLIQLNASWDITRTTKLLWSVLMRAHASRLPSTSPIVLRLIERNIGLLLSSFASTCPLSNDVAQVAEWSTLLLSTASKGHTDFNGVADIDPLRACAFFISVAYCSKENIFTSCCDLGLRTVRTILKEKSDDALFAASFEGDNSNNNNNTAVAALIFDRLLQFVSHSETTHLSSAMHTLGDFVAALQANHDGYGDEISSLMKQFLQKTAVILWPCMTLAVRRESPLYAHVDEIRKHAFRVVATLMSSPNLSTSERLSAMKEVRDQIHQAAEDRGMYGCGAKLRARHVALLLSTLCGETNSHGVHFFAVVRAIVHEVALDSPGEVGTPPPETLSWLATQLACFVLAERCLGGLGGPNLLEEIIAPLLRYVASVSLMKDDDVYLRVCQFDPDAEVGGKVESTPKSRLEYVASHELVVRTVNELERLHYLIAEGFYNSSENAPTPVSEHTVTYCETHRKSLDAYFDALHAPMISASEALRGGSTDTHAMCGSIVLHGWRRLVSLCDRRDATPAVVRELETVCVVVASAMCELDNPDDVLGLISWVQHAHAILKVAQHNTDVVVHALRCLRAHALSHADECLKEGTALFEPSIFVTIQLATLRYVSDAVVRAFICVRDWRGLSEWRASLASCAEAAWERLEEMNTEGVDAAATGLPTLNAIALFVERELIASGAEDAPGVSDAHIYVQIANGLEAATTNDNIAGDENNSLLLESWDLLCDATALRADISVSMPCLGAVLSGAVANDVLLMSHVVQCGLNPSARNIDHVLGSWLHAPTRHDTALSFMAQCAAIDPTEPALPPALAVHTLTRAPAWSPSQVSPHDFIHDSASVQSSLIAERSRWLRDVGMSQRALVELKRDDDTPSRSVQMIQLELDVGNINAALHHALRVIAHDVSPVPHYAGSDIGGDALVAAAALLGLHARDMSDGPDSLLRALERPHELPLQPTPPMGSDAAHVRHYLTQLTSVLYPRRRDTHVAFALSCLTEVELLTTGKNSGVTNASVHDLSVSAVQGLLAALQLPERSSKTTSPCPLSASDTTSTRLLLLLLRHITRDVVQTHSFEETNNKTTLQTTIGLVREAHSRFVPAWCDVLPQLFAYLCHPNADVRDLMLSIIETVTRARPRDVVYQLATGLDTKKGPQALYRRLWSVVVEVLGDMAVNVLHLTRDLYALTDLWEERWSHLLNALAADLTRAAVSYRGSADGAKLLTRLSRSYERFSNLMDSTFRAAAGSDADRGGLTPQDLRLLDVLEVSMTRLSCLFNDTITNVKSESLKEPSQQPPSSTKKSQKKTGATSKPSTTANTRIEHFVARLVAVITEVRITLMGGSEEVSRSRLPVASVSPFLHDLPQHPVPMPGHTNETTSHVKPMMEILATKTRPKQFRVVSDQGHTYTYLVKGKEDMHLDERVMQLLSVLDRYVQLDEQCARRGYHVQHYPVVPLSDLGGLVCCVDDVSSIYALHRQYARRQKSSAPFRPIEQFAAKMRALGVNTASTGREEWTPEVLKRAVKELANESPKDLLEKELWARGLSIDCAASPNTALRGGTQPPLQGWYNRTRCFAQSLSLMSVVGSVIGLGDRHLDNILVNYETGDVLHIDYNVCFGKGSALRVPEVVPFRLTPILATALGPAGTEGTFRTTAEHTMAVLRNNRGVIMDLLSAFIHDPVVEWRSARSTDITPVQADAVVEAVRCLERFTGALVECRDDVQSSLVLLDRLIAAIFPQERRDGLRAVQGLIEEIDKLERQLSTDGDSPAASPSTVASETHRQQERDINDMLADVRSTTRLCANEHSILQSHVSNLFNAADVLAQPVAPWTVTAPSELPKMPGVQGMKLGKSFREALPRVIEGTAALTKLHTSLRGNLGLILSLIRACDKLRKDIPYADCTVAAYLQHQLEVVCNPLTEAGDVHRREVESAMKITKEMTAEHLEPPIPGALQQAQHYCDAVAVVFSSAERLSNAFKFLSQIDATQKQGGEPWPPNSTPGDDCRGLESVRRIVERVQKITGPATESAKHSNPSVTPAAPVTDTTATDSIGDVFSAPKWELLKSVELCLSGIRAVPQCAPTELGFGLPDVAKTRLTSLDALLAWLRQCYVEVATDVKLSMLTTAKDIDKRVIDPLLQLPQKKLSNTALVNAALWTNVVRQLADDLKDASNGLLATASLFDKHTTHTKMVQIVQHHFTVLLRACALPTVDSVFGGIHDYLTRCVQSKPQGAVKGSAESAKKALAYVDSVTQHLILTRVMAITSVFKKSMHYEGLERSLRNDSMPYFWLYGATLKAEDLSVSVRRRTVQLRDGVTAELQQCAQRVGTAVKEFEEGALGPLLNVVEEMKKCAGGSPALTLFELDLTTRLQGLKQELALLQGVVDVEAQRAVNGSGTELRNDVMTCLRGLLDAVQLREAAQAAADATARSHHERHQASQHLEQLRQQLVHTHGMYVAASASLLSDRHEAVAELQCSREAATGALSVHRQCVVDVASAISDVELALRELPDSAVTLCSGIIADLSNLSETLEQHVSRLDQVLVIEDDAFFQMLTVCDAEMGGNVDIKAFCLAIEASRATTMRTLGFVTATVSRVATEASTKLVTATTTGKASDSCGTSSEQALGVLHVVQEHLEGHVANNSSSGSPTGGRRGGVRPVASVAEQVQYYLTEATSSDNLSRMYEGWAPWI
eukprot:PhM_4_TR2918/c0_g1_i1/m.12668/K08873/SMG1; serine/threonine-protein kinase SMG1